MEKLTCATCQKSKALLNCGVCDTITCKYCAQFLEEDTFSFLKSKPEILQHSVYCPTCYQEHVESALLKYNQDLEAAKDILVFFKNQGKETRLIKRLEDPINVYECIDYQDAVMRLAFLTLKAGYNGIVDIVVTSEKVRNGNYQTLVWKGTGIPTIIRADKLLRDKSLEQTPN